ncbi:alpha/beta hydrolase [Streptomyces macrosporus]|uniref:Alpha/beta hydrolase n=1 Tax=Streptomyces macrosporus TaxID=44032 RepID=A0ABP5XUA2_9ACTN
METVTSRDGTPIAYERHGDGPPIVLVSGALCDRTANAPLAALLARSFTVYNHDRRGRGASGDSSAPYAVRREVEDIAAVIAAAGGSAAVCGFSSGAALALAAAADGDAGVTHLVMYEPPYSSDEESRRRKAEYTARLTETLAAGRRGDAVELFVRLTGAPSEVVDQLRNSPMWPGCEALAHTLAYDNAVLGDGSPPFERLASVTVPTLVAAGGETWEWMRATARAVADAVPRGEYRELPGQDHDVRPEALAPVLEEFLAADPRG